MSYRLQDGLLVVAGGVMLCAMFLVPWRKVAAGSWTFLRAIPRRALHLVHRVDHWVMAWAETPCGCGRCEQIRRVLDDKEWGRFIGEHEELKPRKRESA